MRAALLKGPRQLSIEDIEKPKVGSHDVLVRILGRQPSAVQILKSIRVGVEPDSPLSLVMNLQV